MSDHTDFSYSDYQYRDADRRRADAEAVAREFAKYGAGYFGNGSEFVTGRDEYGGAKLDTGYIRAAAKRKAEETAREKRNDEAFLRLLAKNTSGRRDSSYLDLDGETVYFPHRGSVAGFRLIHRSGADCRYAFSPARVGPFPTDMDGLGEIGEIRVERYYPCPFCFAGTSVMDELERGDAARVEVIRRSLRTNQWRWECYMKGADSAPSVSDNVQIETSSLFTPYAEFVRLLGANPDMDGVVMSGADVERRKLDNGVGDYIRAKFDCTAKKRPAEELGSVLIQLSLFRYRKAIPFEMFRKRAKSVVYDDFEKVCSDLHLVNMWAQNVTRIDDGWAFDLVGGLIPKNLPRVADGIYMVCLDVGGARMYRDAKFGVYGFIE
ncbi:MAG: hypothetical protein E7474_12765 [Ruminococcaceae bacterium]|nr:hypothetical protein [Oscillospiraceae bacterium]